MKKKAKNCKDVYNQICNNLDQKLDSPQCLKIKRHLEDCPNCAAYLDSLKKTITLYREYPKPQVPGTFHKKLFAMLNLPTTRGKR
ncbi:MAG: hypothetical protein HY800_05055 [Ignavibacteriales bacterium]|nr:hypothetical protein [Ignavibacteriales bacterium]